MPPRTSCPLPRNPGSAWPPSLRRPSPWCPCGRLVPRHPAVRGKGGGGPPSRGPFFAWAKRLPSAAGPVRARRRAGIDGGNRYRPRCCPVLAPARRGRRGKDRGPQSLAWRGHRCLGLLQPWRREAARPGWIRWVVRIRRTCIPVGVHTGQSWESVLRLRRRGQWRELGCLGLRRPLPCPAHRPRGSRRR